MNSFDCLDLHTHEWLQTMDFSNEGDNLVRLDRTAFGVAVLDSEIYVIGGEKDLMVFDIVESFNTLTGMEFGKRWIK